MKCNRCDSTSLQNDGMQIRCYPNGHSQILRDGALLEQELSISKFGKVSIKGKGTYLQQKVDGVVHLICKVCTLPLVARYRHTRYHKECAQAMIKMNASSKFQNLPVTERRRLAAVLVENSKNKVTVNG